MKEKHGEIGRTGLFYTLQVRLQAMTFLIVLLPMLLASWTALSLLRTHLVENSHARIRSSLDAASLASRHELSQVERAIMAVSLDNTVKTTLRLGIYGQLQKKLRQLVEQYGLDFLLITDGLGNVRVSPFPGRILDHDLYDHPVLFNAMLLGRTAEIRLEENQTLLHILEMRGCTIDQGPVIVMEAAFPVTIRNQVVGYALGGVMLSSHPALMARLREAAHCQRVILVAGNRTAAASPGPGPKILPGHPFPARIDYDRSGPAIVTLPTIMDAGGHAEMAAYTVLPADDDPLLALVCVASLSGLHELLANVRGAMAGIFGAGMLLAMLLAGLMSRHIAVPLHRLTQSMAAMRRDGVYAPLAIQRNDEVGTLIRGFNQMGATIEERINDLNREIGQRRLAEQKLADESERLQVILQSIGDGVMAVDREGRVLLFNRAAVEMTGWPQERAMGRRLDGLIRMVSVRTGQPVDPLRDLPGMENGNGHPLGGDLILTGRSGKTFQVTAAVAPLSGEDGEVMGAVVVVRDVSTRRMLEEEVARTRKLESVGVLAGGIAHDFNNLLTAILGNLSLARREAQGLSGLENHLAEAEKASLRARDLTRQLLTFSRGGAPVRESVDLSTLIRDSAVFVARGSRVQPEFVLAENLWPALVDRGQIGQVIDNLVLNGIQAMPQGGRLIIGAVNVEVRPDSSLPLAPGRYVRITVRDHGTGIAPEDREKIFDPYFTTKQAGNGLGLAICHSIVNRHGGHIGFRSSPVLGTVFSVYLPADEAESMEETDQRPEDENGEGAVGSSRILLMDDEAMIRRVSASMLETLGYSVVCVADGREAVTVYREAMAGGQPFTAVILDLTVPGGMGGEEAVRELRRLDPGLRAIVSSGYSRHAVMAEYRKYGFSGVVLKPYRLNDLARVVQEVIRLGG